MRGKSKLYTNKCLQLATEKKKKQKIEDEKKMKSIHKIDIKLKMHVHHIRETEGKKNSKEFNYFPDLNDNLTDVP